MSSQTSIDLCDPLQQANRELDDALRQPVSPPGYRLSLLRSSARRLRRALHDHIRETESPGGFLEEMQQRAPRLSTQLCGLCAEHEVLNRDLEALIEVLLSEDGSQDLDAARSLARRVRGGVRSHQSRANDLFFQAYCTDIGPSD